MEERIQKILARAGYGSRRACEKFISDGRVKVNGRVVILGEKADAAVDRIEVDGRLVPQSEPLLYAAVYKPRGVLSTVTAPDPRPTVVDLVPIPERLYPVGRLDIESEGLMLLTNDGEMANRLTHPRYGHEKEYRVLVASRPDDEQLATWRRGVVLEDGYRTQPVRIWMVDTFGKGAWLGIVMTEGRKRQIRETGTQLGLPVVKIIRIRIGSLQIGSLKPGEWRMLSPAEVSLLSGPPVVDRPRSSKGAQPVKSQPWEQKNAPAQKYSAKKGPGGPGTRAGRTATGSNRDSAQGKRGTGTPARGPSSGKSTGSAHQSQSTGKSRVNKSGSYRSSQKPASQKSPASQTSAAQKSGSKPYGGTSKPPKSKSR